MNQGSAETGTSHDRPPAASALEHEIPPTVGLARRDLPTSERELALVDRIIALENKLAEANHRYRLGLHQQYYGGQTAPAPQRFAAARGVYGVLLRIPLVGPVARAGVRAARRVRRGGR